MKEKRGRIFGETEVEAAMTDALAERMVEQVGTTNTLIGLRIRNVATDSNNHLVLRLDGGVTLYAAVWQLEGGTFGDALRAENQRQAAEETAKRAPDPAVEYGQRLMNGRDAIEGPMENIEQHLGEASEDV